MLFWPSEEGFGPLTAFITSEVKNGRNFEQIQWNKIFCTIYGLALMQTFSDSMLIKNIDKIQELTSITGYQEFPVPNPKLWILLLLFYFKG